MSYLCWLCLSLPLGVCRRAFLICVGCVCLTSICFSRAHVVLVFLSLPLGVCRRAHVLFVLVVFVFTSRCL